MDLNRLVLIGTIGGKIVERKGKNGTPYIFFPFALENKSGATSTETNYHQDLHIMCWNTRTINYIRRVGAKEGNRVVIVGFVSSFKTEDRGETKIINAINAVDIMVIKSKSDEDIINAYKNKQ